MAWRRGRYSVVGNIDGGSNPAGALCEWPPSLWEATHTAMPPLIFRPGVRVHPGAPILGYIQVP